MARRLQKLQRGRDLASGRLRKTLKRKTARKRLVRVGLIGGNVLVLAAVLVFVITSSRQESPVASVVSANASSTETVAPVDRLTSYDVAANIAEATNLPEKTPIVNQAQSAKVASASVGTSEAGISTKPQVVSTALKSWQDITSYTVQSGDTVASVADKFGVSSNSIRWSNGLTGNYLTAGNTLWIPPISGIVHTVVRGDTPQTLAEKYNSNATKITQYNDGEAGLVIGRRVIIPDGSIRTTTANTYFTASFVPRYGTNGYDYGWCTYYAAAVGGAPSNWGNANTWAYYARLTPGWKVISSPTPGAIFQTPAGWAGHVGIVEEVYSNGTMKISDMNGVAGWGRVGSAIVPVSTYPNYISRG